MRFEVTQLSANEYVPEEIVREEIPDKYLYNDNEGLTVASTFFDSERAVNQLIHFLFQSDISTIEVHRNSDKYVLDLSPFRKQLIDFDYLELFYPKWIEQTGRENTMDEYGMLLDFIGHARKSMGKKYLLMVVSSR